MFIVLCRKAIETWGIEKVELPEFWLFEATKLMGQLAGALLVAWLAVRWALRRYKLEKSWEKRLQAFTDIVLALGQMQSVQLSWLEEHEGAFSWAPEHKSDLSRRYQSAKIKLEESRAMAALILPDSTGECIRSLFAALERIPEDCPPAELYSRSLDHIDEAMRDILRQGQRALGKFY
ncbi:hypothetical protein J2W22_003023 [Sphingomonas kyeonggiensis]|uniref:hypothetical protein n=1 Tax=Sphingomonas kyeonggiensis TaxID=1268553 RepID=UPI0027863920|nr:hypothetical protein [Sphingomonas kyeonggiensis]MDQ0250959.1 hypothetical protein [Sphingomonas kyeonggiensis]